MNLNNLFNFMPSGIVLHSGQTSHFKIDCDALSNLDIRALAWIIKEMVGPFNRVHGVPSGGVRLELELKKYITGKKLGDKPRVLLVDDVLTTGRSMVSFQWKATGYPDGYEIIGAVIFARGKCPDWVTPVFQMGKI